MQNTNDYLHAQNTTAFGNTKHQAPSPKLQASSSKKLDKSSRVGYCRSQGQARDGQAIDICGGPLMGPRNSAAEILQLRGRYDRQEKIPARARNGSCRVMVPAPRTSIKHLGHGGLKLVPGSMLACLLDEGFACLSVDRARWSTVLESLLAC